MDTFNSIIIQSFIISLINITVLSLNEEELTAFKSSPNIRLTNKKHSYKIVTSGLPDHHIGPFDHQDVIVDPSSKRYKIPKDPIPNEVPKCLNQGPIGFAINGIPFYNPYTSNGFDAGHTIEADSCGGHIDHKGRYHYHTMPACLFNPNITDQLLGVAMDGYPIYGPIDVTGNVIKSKDLDLCHGRLENGFYVYRATFDFPYLLGCYHGKTITKTSGHCIVASHRNPALEGLWKKRPQIKETESRKFETLKYEGDIQPVDIHSKKFRKMKMKTLELLIRRNSQD